MQGVQCYELFGGIALKNLAFFNITGICQNIQFDVNVNISDSSKLCVAKGDS